METRVGKQGTHPIIEALIERINQLRDEGTTWESIAERIGHGVSHTTVRRWAIRENPPNSVETATAAFISLGGDVMAILEDELALVAMVSLYSKLSEAQREIVLKRIRTMSPETFIERITGESSDE